MEEVTGHGHRAGRRPLPRDLPRPSVDVVPHDRASEVGAWTRTWWVRPVSRRNSAEKDRTSRAAGNGSRPVLPPGGPPSSSGGRDASRSVDTVPWSAGGVPRRSRGTSGPSRGRRTGRRGPVGGVGPGHHEHAGGLPVEPVDDPRARPPPIPDKVSSGEERVHEGPAGMARRGVDHHPRGLFDDRRCASSYSTEGEDPRGSSRAGRAEGRRRHRFSAVRRVEGRRTAPGSSTFPPRSGAGPRARERPGTAHGRYRSSRSPARSAGTVRRSAPIGGIVHPTRPSRGSAR